MKNIATMVLYGPRYYSSTEVSAFLHKLYNNGFTRDGAAWKREVTFDGHKIQQVLRLKENALYEYCASLTAIDKQRLPPQVEEAALREFKSILFELELRLVEETKL